MSEQAPEPVVITQEHACEGGRIFEITINRPQVHNCVNGEAAELLLAAWTRFRDDDDLTVAVLRGAGETAFCSGADLAALETLTQLHEQPDASTPQARHGTGPMGGSRIVQAKPVITCSQGFTYAGGLELFCHGHIRIAEQPATFSVACRRWGVPLVDGGTVYLPRLLGLGHALPLIITGQRISAERAAEVGLVWEVVSPGHGYARAMEVATQICDLPRDAMLADLNSAIQGWHLDLRAALDREAANFEPVVTSDSMREGVKRFLSGARHWFK